MRHFVFFVSCLLSLFTVLNVSAGASPSSKNLDRGLALQGFDVVSYFKSDGPVEGKKEFQFQYEGATYRFANTENYEEFRKDPTRFLPSYGGWCAYAMADGKFVDVDPRTYKITNGKLLLFYNSWLGNTLKKWNKDEVALQKKADDHWKSIFETSAIKDTK